MEQPLPLAESPTAEGVARASVARTISGLHQRSNQESIDDRLQRPTKPYDKRLPSITRIAKWLDTYLRCGRQLLLVWRTRAQHRSALFYAPESVKHEVAARGLDVHQEIHKHFWRE